MALGDGSVWDEVNPQQSTLANQEDAYNRDVRTGVRVRMQNEHVWPSAQTGSSQAGQHTYVTFQAQVAPPAMPVVNSVTQSAMLFSSSGGSQLAFQNSAGNQISLVSTTGDRVIASGLYSATGSNGEIIIGSAGGAIQALAPGSSGSVLVAGASGNQVSWQQVLSTRSAPLVVGTIYQATGPGLVYVWGQAGAGAPSTITLLSDTNATPSTTVGLIDCNFSTAGARINGTITYPILSGEYFKITTGNGCTVSKYILHNFN